MAEAVTRSFKMAWQRVSESNMKIIESQSYKEAMPAKIHLPDETIAKIVELYLGGQSLTQIGNSFGLTPAKVRSVLLKNNVKIRTMSEGQQLRKQDPEYVKNKSKALSERLKTLWQKEDYKADQSNRLKERWQDPKFQQEQSQMSKNLWQDPEFAKNRSEERKEWWKKEENINRQKQIQKERWENEELIQQQSKRMKDMWNDPEKAKEMIEGQKRRWKDPIQLENSSEKMKKWWAERGGFWEHLSTLSVDKQNAYIMSVCGEKETNNNVREKCFYKIRTILDKYIEQKNAPNF